MSHVFDDAQCHAIYQEYTAPDQPSMRDLAEKHYVSPRVISMAFRRIGKPARPKNFTRFNIPMIMHDWNADKPTGSIARAHGTTVAALHVHISGWRKQGWGFKRRR